MDLEADHGTDRWNGAGDLGDPTRFPPPPASTYEEADARPRSTRRPRSGEWPLSAICAVAVASVAAALLLLMNVFGLRIGGGSYDAETGGSMAEWFEALATLVTLPVAVLVGVRQLRSTSEQIELGRQRLVVEETERLERMRAEQARLRDSVPVRTLVANVVDHADLATDPERAAVERWRNEYRVRGWTPDAAGETWSRDEARRTNVDLLAAETSPLLPKPWFAAVECTNAGIVTVTLQRWTVVVDGASTTMELSSELRPGATWCRRLGPEVGLAATYARSGDVQSRLAAVTVIVDAADDTGRAAQFIATQQ